MYRNIYIYFSKRQGKKNTDQETETILLQARDYYSSYELAHLFAPRLWKVCINSVDCNPLMTVTISVLNALNLIRSQWIVCFSNYHMLRKSGIQAWPALRHSFIDPDSLILKVVKLPLTSVRALCLCERSLSYVYLKINKVNWIKESGMCSASAFGKEASFIPSQGRQWNQNGSVNRAWFDFILPHLQISTFLMHIFWKAQPESIPELLLPKCFL